MTKLYMYMNLCFWCIAPSVLLIYLFICLFIYFKIILSRNCDRCAIARLAKSWICVCRAHMCYRHGNSHPWEKEWESKRDCALCVDGRVFLKHQNNLETFWSRLTVWCRSVQSPQCVQKGANWISSRCGVSLLCEYLIGLIEGRKHIGMFWRDNKHNSRFIQRLFVISRR